jgi:hypothetical protein
VTYYASTNANLPRGAAGRGVGKVEPGLEKILDVGLDFKNGICPAHPRSDVGLEKLRALCEAYAKSIKRGHKKIHIWSPKPRLCICAASTEHKETSMDDESIDAENRADEITGWLNGLKMSVALRICRAYTKKKLSSLKILSMQISKTMRKVIVQITSRTTRMKKKTQKKGLTKKT